MDSRVGHWDAVFGTKPEDSLSWYEAEPRLSYDLVTRHLAPGAPVIDVGGGASRLGARLVGAGYGPLTVLDVSPAALALQAARLGGAATLIAADVTRWRPVARHALWHDRAVFHFLTDAEDRAAYVRALSAALLPGGVAVIATFAADGPERCSGLPVVRYAPEELAALLERLAPGRFAPLDARAHAHVTPAGRTQRFQYSLFRRIDGPAPEPAAA